MLKAALLSVFGVFVFGLVSNDDGVFVAHNVPEYMEAGTSEVVSVVINKAEAQGFGKLLINVPIGFEVEAVDTREASFTFEDNKAKFIWMVMPASEEFTVTYKLTAPSSFKGVVNIGGTFSYIKNNQRIDYEILEKTITEGAEEIVEEVEETTDTVADMTTNEAEVLSEENETINLENLGCKREFERVADDRVLVIVTIYESELRGFGKVQDSFNSKYEVIEGDSDGAITTFEDGSVKYVWFEVPEKREFYVSYYIQHEDLAFEEPMIDGSFTYVYDDKPVEISIIQTNNLEPVTDPLVENQDAVIEEETVVEEVEEVVEEVVQEVEENEIEAITEKVEVTSIPDPETGITYKVQIVAGPNTVGKSYMRKNYNFYDKFNIENHEGWVKYTTGSFDVYKGARDHREVISGQYDFDGPFVTAYNEGVRITVQEALMITNQKWYQ